MWHLERWQLRGRNVEKRLTGESFRFKCYSSPHVYPLLSHTLSVSAPNYHSDGCQMAIFCRHFFHICYRLSFHEKEELSHLSTYSFVYLSVSWFLYTPVDSGVPISFHVLKFTTVTIYFVDQNYPRFGYLESLQAGFPCILWEFPYFLAQQQVLGLFCSFPNPSLGLLIALRSSGSFR